MAKAYSETAPIGWKRGKAAGLFNFYLKRGQL
jgi:hypothetical protein